MENVRCFLAIPINDKELISKIENLKNKLLATGADVKPVEKENIHYNLKFFNYKTKGEVQKIIKVIEETINEEKQFKIDIGGLGTFPTPNSIRVVWIGLRQGEKEMVSLTDKFENAFSMIGIEKENRPFQPHLTLCRVRSSNNMDALKKEINAERDIIIGSMVVNELVLYQSILSRKGPIYLEIKRFRLGK